jgi:CheY-like chemotaxis protein
MQILYVEDDADNCFLIKMALEKMEGCHVITAPSVEAARQIWADARVKGTPFQAVLVDYHLGFSNGGILVREFKEQSPGTSFVGITSDDLKLQQLLDDGCCHVFLKPLRRNWTEEFFEHILS